MKTIEKRTKTTAKQHQNYKQKHIKTNISKKLHKKYDNTKVVQINKTDQIGRSNSETCLNKYTFCKTNLPEGEL